MILARVALLTTMLALSCSSAIAGRIPPTPEQLRAWKDLESSSSVPLEIQWSHRSGTPATIRVKEPVGAGGVQRIGRSRAEWTAASFLDENATALFAMRVDRDSLRYARTVHSHGKWKVFFDQTWRGVRVRGSDCMVQLAFDGSLEQMNARWDPLERGGHDWIAPREAERRALAALRDRKWSVARIELARERLRRRFAYELLLIASGDEVRVRVDSVTGRIRSRSRWVHRSAMVR